MSHWIKETLVACKFEKIMDFKQKGKDEKIIRNTMSSLYGDEINRETGRTYGSMVEGYPVEFVTDKVRTEEEARRKALSLESAVHFGQAIVAVLCETGSISKEDRTRISAEQQRLSDIEQQLSEFYRTHSVGKRKSSLVGCPNCGSRISVSYYRESDPEWTCLTKRPYASAYTGKSFDRCPVCGKVLNSETDRNRADGYLEKIKKEYVKIREMEQKAKQKHARRYWYCLASVHD